MLYGKWLKIIFHCLHGLRVLCEDLKQQCVASAGGLGNLLDKAVKVEVVNSRCLSLGIGCELDEVLAHGVHGFNLGLDGCDMLVGIA